MKTDKVLCPSCGASVASGDEACPSCGAAVAAPDAPPRFPSGAVPAAAAEGATGETSAPAGPPGSASSKPPRKVAGFLARRGKAPTFAAAPRLPAPLRVARPPAGFEPEAGIALDAKRRGRRRRKDEPVEGAVEEERREEDRTPPAVYWTILLVSLVSLFVAFLFWNSSSIGDPWRYSFLVEMALFGIIVLIVSTRLARQQEWDERARSGVGGMAMGGVRVLAWVWETLKKVVYALTIGLAKRLLKMVQEAKEGAVRSVQRAGVGVKRAGEGVKKGGAQFREGFHSDAKPNFLVRMMQGVVRFVTRIVFGVIRLVINVFRLIGWVWKTVVRIGWSLYQGIVLPVVLLAWRISRGVLRVTYRTARWTLRLAWRIMYWVLRRFPLSYITQAAEPPVRRTFEPRILLVNVLVSDFLAAPVRPEVRTKAEPFVASWRLHHDAEKAARLMEKHDQHESLAQEYLVIPSAEERRRLREERARLKLERKEELRRQEQEAKQAHQQAKLDAKAAKKESRLAAKEMSTEDRAALKEAERKQKEEEKARRQAEKERLTSLSPEEKKAFADARKAQRKAAQEAAKAERLASKQEDERGGPDEAVVVAKTSGDRFKDRLRVKQPGDASTGEAPAAETAEATTVPVRTQRERKATIRSRQKELGRRLTPAEKKAFKRRRKLEKIQAKAREGREKKQAKVAEKEAKKAEKAALKETKAAEKGERQAAKADEKQAKDDGDKLASTATTE